MFFKKRYEACDPHTAEIRRKTISTRSLTTHLLQVFLPYIDSNRYSYPTEAPYLQQYARMYATMPTGRLVTSPVSC
jgi:hypothetical protein